MRIYDPHSAAKAVAEGDRGGRVQEKLAQKLVPRGLMAFQSLSKFAASC